MASLLIIEPYYGGSHKQLIDTLVKGLNLENSTCLVTLPAKKWHWRARTSALRISQLVPTDHNFKVLFASCVLNLAELIALRPDLSLLHKIVYFHENQLVYPVRKVQNRDFQYGYNQILTCLVADKVIFNSEFNRDSFLDAMPKFMKLQPDCRPVGLSDKIKPKCDILYFPVNFPTVNNPTSCNGALHIVWPHRWEHDKDPDTFVSVLLELVEAGLQFRISMLGQSSADVPQCVTAARYTLGSRVVCWGRQDRREDYLRTLSEADVVVSTAIHEFFGVAMLEAVACDCYPLCPDRLVYPEFYPAECIYKSPQHLKQILSDFCLNPQKPRQKLKDLNIDLTKFGSQKLLPLFKQLLIIPD